LNPLEARLLGEIKTDSKEVRDVGEEEEERERENGGGSKSAF
jgi:hypothetical protein